MRPYFRVFFLFSALFSFLDRHGAHLLPYQANTNSSDPLTDVPCGCGTWACLVHGLQCLCDGRACCPPLFMQRIALEVSPAPSPCCFNSLLIGMVRVGVKIPQDGNCADLHGRVAVVYKHVWRTVCSVCATGARVAHPVPCNS